MDSGIADGRMQIHGIPADADQVGPSRLLGVRLQRRQDVLLDDARERDDLARLTDVRELGQAVGRAHHLGPQLQFRVAEAALVARAFGLQPIQEAK
jgi:hypothetical protein